jgi:hypothetical protein
VKVVKPAKEFTPILFDCRCGAQLEAELKDFKLVVDDDPRGGSGSFAVATCPICKDELHARREAIPDYLLRTLPRK